MFRRFLEDLFLRSVKTFPVVVLTGARQTGKSTLCRMLLRRTHQYVSLEDPDIRQQAIEDPRTFLANFPPPVVLDEIQNVPQLPSYIQGLVDKNRHAYGQYVLTGSQHFLLMERVSQSLAGRAALLTLYPCSVAEIDGKNAKPRFSPKALADWILKGGYPELRARKDLDRRTWCANYIQLYLERDVRSIINIRDLTLFERFLRLIAIRTGQILNISDLARDIGVSVPTISRWISILRTSYQLYLLEPFHANLSKRLIKSPKIYFGDTALASFLMGINNEEILLHGPFLGPLLETAVFLEHMKWASFQGKIPFFSYFRTKDGLEIDLFIEEGREIHAREIKTNRTFSPSMSKSLLETERLLKKPLNKMILAPIEKINRLSSEIVVKPWHWVQW